MCDLIVLFVHSIVLFSSNYSPAVTLLLHTMNLAFAKIPIGGHTVCACVVMSVVCVLISILMRSSVNTIVPFEVLFVGIFTLIVGDILFGMIKFIPVKNKRTGQVKTWAIGMIFSSFILHHTQTTYSHIKQVPGFICPHRIDSISKQELP